MMQNDSDLICCGCLAAPYDTIFDKLLMNYFDLFLQQLKAKKSIAISSRII